MLKWISSKNAKVFAFSMSLYLLVVLVNYLSPVSGDGALAQRFQLLLYVGPGLILAATIFDIYRDRARARDTSRNNPEEKS